MKTKHVIVSFLAPTLATVSAPQPLYDEWAYNFNDHVETAVQINHSSVGSGQGNLLWK